MGHGERFEELYLLKGIALLAMIVYHAFLVYGFVNNGYFTTTSILYPLPIAGSFMFLSGISISIIDEKEKRNKVYKRVIARLAISSIVITVVTVFLLPNYAIWFGILHLLLFCYVVSWLVLNKRYSAVFLLLILLIGGMLQYFFWPFGSALDHTPIIPYSGIVFAGVIIGRLTYAKGKRLHLPRSKPLEIIGKRSLWIYLGHLPAIYIVFWMLFR